MTKNKAFTLKIKNQDNTYSDIYLKTTQEQVIGWNIGELYGPYIIKLKASDWLSNNTLIYTGVPTTSDSVVICSLVTQGTEQQQRQQIVAYSLLDSNKGVESFSNRLIFSCKRKPETDITLQVFWTK